MAEIGGTVHSAEENRRQNQLTILLGYQDEINHRVFLRKDKDLVRGKIRIALIIGEFGTPDNELIQDFLNLNRKISVSILPGSESSKEIARQAIEGGFEVILQMPMEPRECPEIDPGRYTILTTHSYDEVRKKIDLALNDLEKVQGVCNYLGGKATEDTRLMTRVVKELKKKSLFFIDKGTSQNSVAYQVAQKYGLKSANNPFYINISQSPHNGREQMERLAAIAFHKGKAIACGDYDQETADLLKDTIGHWESRGIELVYASELVE